MEWDELFGGMDKGVNKDEQKWMFLNALLVAGIDGTVDSAEVVMLRRIQEKLGLSTEELQEIQKNPKAVKFAPPKTERERFAHLVDLVFVMIADAKIDPMESKLVQQVANILGFKPVVVPVIVKRIAEAIRNNYSRSNIITDLGSSV